MPPERQSTQKRRQLPFKPPSRSSTDAAGPSQSKPKSTTKKTTTSATTKRKTNAVASSSKSTVISRRKSPSPVDSDGSARDSDRHQSLSPSGSDSGSVVEEGGRRGGGRENQYLSFSPIEEPDYILAEITHNDNTADEDVGLSEPMIPQKLLTRLLHQHFRNEKTKIAKDANAVVAKYIDVYVREAVARAAYERAETGMSGVADGFLEVEDLEKMGPQLAMDF